MTGEDIAAKIVRSAAVTKRAAQAALDDVIGAVEAEQRRGVRVARGGFGKSTARKADVRVVRNPKTGKVVKIPVRMRPTSKAGAAVSDAVKRVR